MGTFNKAIGFLCGLKSFVLNIFCGEFLQSSLHLMLQIWWNPLLWKMCQQIMMRFQTYRPLKLKFGKWYLLPYLVVPLISARIPLISTRVSAHCQAILLGFLYGQSQGQRIESIRILGLLCMNVFELQTYIRSNEKYKVHIKMSWIWYSCFHFHKRVLYLI